MEGILQHPPPELQSSLSDALDSLPVECNESDLWKAINRVRRRFQLFFASQISKHYAVESPKRCPYVVWWRGADDHLHSACLVPYSTPQTGWPYATAKFGWTWRISVDYLTYYISTAAEKRLGLIDEWERGPRNREQIVELSCHPGELMDFAKWIVDRILWRDDRLPELPQPPHALTKRFPVDHCYAWSVAAAAAYDEAQARLNAARDRSRARRATA